MKGNEKVLDQALQDVGKLVYAKQARTRTRLSLLLDVFSCFPLKKIGWDFPGSPPQDPNRKMGPNECFMDKTVREIGYLFAVVQCDTPAAGKKAYVKLSKELLILSSFAKTPVGTEFFQHYVSTKFLSDEDQSA